MSKEESKSVQKDIFSKSCAKIILQVQQKCYWQDRQESVWKRSRTSILWRVKSRKSVWEELLSKVLSTWTLMSKRKVEHSW